MNVCQVLLEEELREFTASLRRQLVEVEVRHTLVRFGLVGT
jgi:hypothetical protein